MLRRLLDRLLPQHPSFRRVFSPRRMGPIAVGTVKEDRVAVGTVEARRPRTLVEAGTEIDICADSCMGTSPTVLDTGVVITVYDQLFWEPIPIAKILRSDGRTGTCVAVHVAPPDPDCGWPRWHVNVNDVQWKPVE